MITAAVVTNGDWSQRVETIASEYAQIVQLSMHEALDGSVPLDMAFLEMEYLTDELISAAGRIRQVQDGCALACIANELVAERLRVENLIDADFWIIVPVTDMQLQAQVEAMCTAVNGATASASGRHETAQIHRRSVIKQHHDARGPQQAENVLSRAVGKMAGCFDTAKLRAAYCDAVRELAHPVSHCLLWRNSDTGRFDIAHSDGLPASVSENYRLSPDSALVNWLTKNRQLVTIDMLAANVHGTQAGRELEALGGVLAIPMLSDGGLRAIMILGPKAVGEQYLMGELETLFMLSTSLLSAVRQSELHQELESQNDYIDQVLSTMASGIITLGADGKICVCNPHAAEILEMDTQQVIGSDLRILPSPLGDYLYACMENGEQLSRHEIEILGARKALSISTRRLNDENGTIIGSMMLLDDISAQRALDEEKRKALRNEVINQIVSRFAHELKNPLATIRTFMELLPERYHDEEFKNFCSEYVMRDVHRLDHLVTKLVSLSEAPESRSESADVSELLHEARSRVALLDEKAAEKIEFVEDGNLPKVKADKNATAAALAYLLRYSAATTDKAVTVHSRLERPSEHEQRVVMRIAAPSEAGTAKDLQQVLDPSYVIDHPDLDLGPSASQRLVEGQGGSLQALRENDTDVFEVSLTPENEDQD